MTVAKVTDRIERFYLSAIDLIIRQGIFRLIELSPEP